MDYKGIKNPSRRNQVFYKVFEKSHNWKQTQLTKTDLSS